jgi:hypothetical protein
MVADSTHGATVVQKTRAERNQSRVREKTNRAEAGVRTEEREGKTRSARSALSDGSWEEAYRGVLLTWQPGRTGPRGLCRCWEKYVALRAHPRPALCSHARITTGAHWKENTQERKTPSGKRIRSRTEPEADNAHTKK